MKKATLSKAIERATAVHTRRGFSVTLMCAETQFACLAEDLMTKHNIAMSIAAANKHKPFIERSIQTLKGRIRCGF